MAVSKTTVCKQDRSQKDSTSNPIPTSFSKLYNAVPIYLIAELRRTSCQKKEFRDGVTCVVFL